MHRLIARLAAAGAFAAFLAAPALAANPTPEFGTEILDAPPTWLGQTGYPFFNGAGAATVLPTIPGTSVSIAGSATGHLLCANGGVVGDCGGFRTFALSGGDDTAAINSQIAALYAAGGGTLSLSAGTTYVSGAGWLLKSWVRVIGQGDATNLICDTSPCVTQPAGSQLYAGGLTHVHFTAGGGEAGATVLAIGSSQYSEFGWFSFSGFSTGTLGAIAGVTVSSFDNANVGQNIIFNSFHDWLDWDGVANGFTIFGKYGSSPPSPLSGGMVVTQNEFRNLNIKFSNKCIDIIADADTNSFYNPLCVLNAPSGTEAIVQGDDPTYSTVNTYVNSNKFYNPVFSAGAGVTLTGGSIFAGNYSFGTEAYGISTDINLNTSGVVLNAMTLDQSHRFLGGGFDATGDFSNTLEGEDVYNVARVNRLLTLAPSTGGIITTATTTGYSGLVLTTNGTIATLQVQFPTAARDNDKFSLGTTATTVTALTMAPASGDSIVQPPTSIAPGQAYTWRYLLASKYWLLTNG